MRRCDRRSESEKHMTEHRLGNFAKGRCSLAMLANGAINSYRDMRTGPLKIRPFG
jgi:hypothetical protein